MNCIIACTIATLLLPGAASAQLRRQPSPLPPPAAPLPAGYERGGGDMRAQDEWDRALRHCLNDRRQNKRERRQCADRGMPTRR